VGHWAVAVEGLGLMTPDFRKSYNGRRIFVTGHTGFKGSWLCQWLVNLGAVVKGYALDPPSQPSLFDELQLSKQLNDVRADIRNKARLEQEITNFEPEFIFHLAAQPLVRYSYSNPVETYETNVLGTVYLLEALRQWDHPCVVVVVTTDKCYENREWCYGYREVDPMGGADPYSSSKGMAELAVSAWRRSYWQDSRIRLASARAGNVIGGGDWALDRILPDCIRAIQAGQPIDVRNPRATRPWQHVLDPLAGYLLLASKLDIRENSASETTPLCDGFNFGPATESCRPVRDVVETLLKHISGSWRNLQTGPSVHEAGLLHLCTDKARAVLGWRPVWDFEQSLFRTAEWYREYAQTKDALFLVNMQLEAFAQSSR
jgi:CDP-glucose 4,6-dehydratase